MKQVILSLGLVLLPHGLWAQEMLKPIAPKFKPDPIVIEGKVEGTVPLGEVVKGKATKGNCGGYSTDSPTYVLPLAKDFPYLNLKVRGEGVMVMVQGPDGIFCRQGNPEIAGIWTAGVYQIWIGTQSKTKAKFRLSLSETDQ